MVAVAGVLLASLILVNTNADQSRERSLVSEDLRRHLTLTSEFLRSEVEPGSSTETTLDNVASQPEVRALGDGCRQALSGLQKAIEFGYLEVIDAAGRVLCSPEAGRGGPGTPWAGEPALLRHVAARMAASDAPVKDPRSGELLLYTVVPLKTPTPASLLYVAGTQNALAPEDTGEDSVETLLLDRRTGTVLMRFPERSGLVGTVVRDADLLGAGSRTGLFTTDGVDGVSRLYQATTVADTEFLLLVGKPEAEAYASARHNLQRNLLLGAVLMLVMALLGAVLQRRVARPARRLREAIERTGRGEAVEAPTDGPAELAVLGSSFNEMIAARRGYEEALAHQARHDPLTDLPNRRQVTELLAEHIAEGRPCAAVFVDLDRFKLINDAHGHAVGDEVLVALGRHLLAVARPGEVVGRFGGDEFVVVAAGLDAEGGAREVARRVSQALEQPVTVGARELFVSGSVGVAVHVPGEDAETVLRHADTAMYRAKEAGRNCTAVFDEAMREEADRRLRMETDLHRALDRGELHLVYQPVLDLEGGRVLGAEALIRWQHPEHGPLSPADFIPVAEETGLIVPIGAWVLREACGWAAVTSERLGSPVFVSVNVSPLQVAQPTFNEVVDEALAMTGLAPSQLTIEVTETLLVQDAELAAQALGQLRSSGVRIAIDDFGTGWSSLTYLQTLPVDEIKLDRSYVGLVDHDAASATIVASMIGMAKALGLDITAEGVETDAQCRYLQSQGCPKAQGFLFQRPVAGDVLRATLLEGGTLWTTPAKNP
jgi:diguanylate cyclase (GGDEF)-like protein